MIDILDNHRPHLTINGGKAVHVVPVKTIEDIISGKLKISDIDDFAKQMDYTMPHSAEKMVWLRKLLEAKDCFVRAKLGDK